MLRLRVSKPSQGVAQLVFSIDTEHTHGAHSKEAGHENIDVSPDALPGFAGRF